MPKDKNGKELGVGDFVKFKPQADAPYVIGRIAHLDTHNVPKLDKDGDQIHKKVDLAKGHLGGLETEPRVGQVIYLRGNATDVVYLDETVELVLKAGTTK